VGLETPVETIHPPLIFQQAEVVELEVLVRLHQQLDQFQFPVEQGMQ
jgi:hypothetical protein